MKKVVDFTKNPPIEIISKSFNSGAFFFFRNLNSLTFLAFYVII